MKMADEIKLSGRKNVLVSLRAKARYI